MKTSGLSRYALSGCLAATMLAGCGGSQPLNGAPGAMPQTSVPSRTNKSSYKVVYSFGVPDGSDPFGGLVDVNGTLYGTTIAGGTNANGTVFSITTDGAERVLHRFIRWVCLRRASCAATGLLGRIRLT